MEVNGSSDLPDLDAMNKRLSRREMLAVGGLVIVGVALCICAHYEQRFPGDLRLTQLLQSVHNQTLDSLMKWVSFLTGDWRAPVLVLVSGMVAWRYLGKREAALVLMTLLSSPLSSVLKLMVGRPRPTPDLVAVFQVETGNSFPSGHAFFAIVFWGLLAYFALTHLERRCFRMLTVYGLAVIIIWIGVSRVYLGAHWPSDVLGGYVIGTLFLTSLVWLDRRWRSRIETGNPAEPVRPDSGTRPPENPT
jgi:membrane-associated phospholipid phosphatase